MQIGVCIHIGKEAVYADNCNKDNTSVCHGYFIAANHGKKADRRASAVGTGGCHNDFGFGDGAYGIGGHTAVIGNNSCFNAYIG